MINSIIFANSLNEDFLKIFLSMLAGAVIGAEREYKSKDAGFRTITLITIGSTLFTLLSKEIADGKDFHIVGNIVVGVGFLGAGAIFKNTSNVTGLTTAATIWISAAVGMAIGAGEYQFAFVTLVTVLIILYGFSGIQAIIDNWNSERYYKISIKNELDAHLFIEQLIKECKLKSKQISISKIGENLHYTIRISGRSASHRQLVSLFSTSDEIISFEV